MPVGRRKEPYNAKQWAPMPNPPDLLRFYLEYLKENTESIKDDFEDSFVHPCSYWTGWEKAAFFDALKRHSRMRPELIQEEIGDSKTLWEVCLYINLLDTASSSNELPESAYASTSVAVEMSKKWIAFEQKQAGAVMAYEEHLLDEFHRNKVLEERSTGEIPETVTGKWETRRVFQSLDVGKLAALDFLLGDPEPQTNADAPEKVTSIIPMVRYGTPAIDVEDMSVTERKRWRNRLYMRRRRAESVGSEVDESTDRLKPGRRQKLTAVKAGKRGRIAFEKNKALLVNAGIDSEQLQSLDMDMFNLKAFGGLAE